MGAWGIKTFENDDASDWLYELEESSDLSVISNAFQETDTDYLEAPEACNVLAAAEVLLSLLGKGRALPENADNWVKSNDLLNATPLVPLAVNAIEVVISDKSELNELWQETKEDYLNWKKDVEEIKSALQSS